MHYLQLVLGGLVIKFYLLKKTFLSTYILTFWQKWQNSQKCLTEKNLITVKGLKSATSCVRGQDASTVPARHISEARSLNWLQFMLQWFIRFPEFAEFTAFLFHLGKTLMSTWSSVDWPIFKCNFHLRNRYKTINNTNFSVWYIFFGGATDTPIFNAK